MAKRKGLFHIIESVIISIAMFVMLSQITYIQGSGPEWSNEKLVVQGRDILYSLSASGIDWSDETNVAGYLDYAFNDSNAAYRLEYRGAPQDSISVGCLCDGSAGCSSFCTWLDTHLSGYSGMEYNSMDVGFSMTETDNVNTLFDVMVSNQGLSGRERNVRNFLSSGRGFVLVRDLEQQDFDDYGDILTGYFAVNVSSGSSSGSVSFELTDISNEPEYAMIPGYFSATPNGTWDRYNESHVFSGFVSSRMQKVPGAGGRTILKATSGAPACIAKYSAASNRGRSAWLAGSQGDDDWETLLTSLVIWSSDHTRFVSGTEIGSEESTTYIYAIPGDPSSNDYVFQPMEVVLTMGYLFRQ